MSDVSFVVTLYNKAKYIPALTNSIFLQKNLGDCEYIFIDDGSTDDTLSILEQCTSSHANVKIISQHNAGPSLATNRGIFEATRPFIKFVDGDEILHPLGTSELFKAMSMLNVEMAFSHGEEIPFTSEKMQAPNLPLSKRAPTIIDKPLEVVAKTAIFNLTCLLASAKVIHDMGGCDTKVFIQDYSFALRLANNTKFAFVPSTLYWAPLEVTDRASDLGDGAQVLHDSNLAMGYFVAENPGLGPSIKALMLQRAAGRAWKWARRREGETLLSKHYYRYFWSMLSPGSGDTAERILATCQSFPARNIRFTPYTDK
jgi:glycosyltransferase involved in cell wall biosynthesis